MLSEAIAFDNTAEAVIKNQPKLKAVDSTANDNLPGQNEFIEGFIHHPNAFPIHAKKRWFNRANSDAYGNGMGLCFQSEKYFSPGSSVAITIPLRGEEQTFIGQVVLVRSQSEQYEIGLWFDQIDVINRIRIVEQICHIEVYLKQKQRTEGPFVSKEKVAEEWIQKFAGVFPSVS